MHYHIVVTDHWWVDLAIERKVAGALGDVEVIDAQCETPTRSRPPSPKPTESSTTCTS